MRSNLPSDACSGKGGGGENLPPLPFHRLCPDRRTRPVAAGLQPSHPLVAGGAMTDESPDAPALLQRSLADEMSAVLGPGGQGNCI